LARKIKLRQYTKIVEEKILKPSLNKRGYLYIWLCKNAKYKGFRIHRIVAKTFIPNPENKPQVNHIDRNVLNNCVDNLEWCTNSENMNHAKTTGFRKGEKHA
jgi:hypothetical protein